MKTLFDFMDETRKKLKEKSGVGVIHAAIIFLISMLLLSVLYEFIRIQIVANNIRDSYERAILTVGSENYNEVYSGFREYDYTGGEYQGGPYSRSNIDEMPEWEALNDYGNISEELMELLFLIEKDNTLVSEKDGYELSDIQVLVNNAEYAASGKYEIKGTITMTVPIYLSKVQVTNVEIPLRVMTAYTPKY
ncbi:MAG: hypothetical protein WCD89_18795 [Anaerocolumna sp.]